MTSSLIVRAFGVSLIIAASACGSDAAVRSSEAEPTDAPVSTVSAESTPDTVAPPESESAITIGPPESVDATTPVETTTTMPSEPIGLVATIVDIEYYGACGNETFELDGETWYPLLFDEQEAIDPADYAAAESITEPAGLVRVAPPGPGDDVGTLFVFEDGLGRFVSDSGLIDTWMTTEEQEYLFEC